jgi:hypothetical protein
VCDACWGSGSKSRKWADLRRLTAPTASPAPTLPILPRRPAFVHPDLLSEPSPEPLTVAEALRLPEVRSGESVVRVEAPDGWLHFFRVTTNGLGEPQVERLQRHGEDDPWDHWGGNALSLVDLDAPCALIDAPDGGR